MVLSTYPDRTSLWVPRGIRARVTLTQRLERGHEFGQDATFRFRWAYQNARGLFLIDQCLATLGEILIDPADQLPVFATVDNFNVTAIHHAAAIHPACGFDVGDTARKHQPIPQEFPFPSREN